MTTEFITVEEMYKMESDTFKADGKLATLHDFLPDMVGLIYSVIVLDERTLVLPLLLGHNVTDYDTARAFKIEVCSTATCSLIGKFRKGALCYSTRKLIYICLQSIAKKGKMDIDVLIYAYVHMICKIIKPDCYVGFELEKKQGKNTDDSPFQTFNEYLAKAPKPSEGV